MTTPTQRHTTVAREVPSAASDWDHSTHEQFFEYYARESQSQEAVERFRATRDTVLRIMGRPDRALDVADIGCGAGMQSMVWAEAGHSVHALDINEPLIQLGRDRAAKAGRVIDFRVGTATELPWANESVDVCIALELIEHVADWEGCLREFARVVRPGGVLFLTTTNQLCPLQEEFNLPLFSWYPARVKRHYEKLAVTTRPALANFARYPAVNWFTFYRLQADLAARGFESMDRFQMMDLSGKGASARLLITAMRSVPLLRRLGQICTPGTRILAIKRPAAAVAAAALNRRG
jgi:2-polyprenyl-3-methyl-5-hydroxy-6-metoxy-1,4-benzoquinol methylase